MVTVSQQGQLFIVATPIGNLSDFSYRAVEVLQQVDVIAAEDTRHSKYLLQHYAIKTPTVSLHEHNEQQRSEMLLQRLLSGDSVALISDAGTPLISDPGYRLVSLVRQQGIKVVPVPGSCALIAALSASGLASDRFAFEGFLPAKASARRQFLQQLTNETRTLIFYDSPRRLSDTLSDLSDIFGAERKACLARELTKIHETIETRPLAELRDWVNQDDNQQRGECVVLVEGASTAAAVDEQELQRVLELLLAELPVKKSAAMAAALTGMGKNQAYQLALKLQQK
ncbi:16S rRNA (cytidine(1402)-2'-O)-methyltransferase [Methylophaga sp. OBS4]|uniref:16S rRNA (cytidine(1402)-2'-O)-methyltransferase n=1 Tax=Methylophaga sp. OBS4 TaxID=2991935 RepID=UPI00224FC36C|nr:16S rRNA (cytidine(1402)-2'-O)-methyltransferase [Methylophaga sp. OBS4]MCX4187219.1 16S rRNA (cytidine(1402)-2'-O)-methyltransferase [Methylophaga sp. OBS4]